MSRLTHLTPRYVFDRVVEIAYRWSRRDAPWLTAFMVDILDTWFCPSDRGLEWGGGRSTVWFARRVQHLVTIEENAEWGDRVDDMLRKHGLRDRVELNVVPVNPSEGAASRYVSIATAIPPQSLDFCVVDGDLRDYCARAALPLLKRGAILIIDNVERYVPRKNKSRSPNARGEEDGYASEVWREVIHQTTDWRLIWTTNGVSDTALWVKP
jgi:Methyltransferase domain